MPPLVSEFADQLKLSTFNNQQNDPASVAKQHFHSVLNLLCESLLVADIEDRKYVKISLVFSDYSHLTVIISYFTKLFSVYIAHYSQKSVN